MTFHDYLLSQIPPDIVKKYGLDELIDRSTQKEDTKETNQDSKLLPIHSNFHLPITYLDPSELHVLSPIIAQDLELTVPGSVESIYQHLFKPTSIFGQNMIPSWSQYYTTNITFLEESQQFIKRFSEKTGDEGSGFAPENPSIDYDQFRNIWRDVKEDKSFLEKYGYLEWSLLAHFNENSSFLQCLSIVNVVSPLISLLLPLIFIVLPFIILKIQRIPITFTVYLEVLKSVAKNHFIGKALMSMTSLTWDKAAYLAMTSGLYLLQIYQNVSACQRFCRNMIKINQHLVQLQGFVDHSIHRMEQVVDDVQRFTTYRKFHDELHHNVTILKQIQLEMKSLRPFEPTVSKFCESGYMLRCFYRLHTVPTYESAIRYMTGFEGYMDNLRGICTNMGESKIHMATFVTDTSGGFPLSRSSVREGSTFSETERDGCGFVDQYYPPLIDECPVTNTVDMNKNMILSGPNKAGKTTILKTTALNIIFSQQVGCGFYASAQLCPYTHLHSYLNIPDTSGRDSLFQAESRRCKDILDHIKGGAAGSRHFCIFDELYSGTNPAEATKAGYAFLKYLSKHENVDFMLTTHYVKICKKFLKSDHVENYKMNVNVLENGEFHYTYKMKRGISKIQGAVRVMRDMDYPEEIIKGM